MMRISQTQKKRSAAAKANNSGFVQLPPLPPDCQKVTDHTTRVTISSWPARQLLFPIHVNPQDRYSSQPQSLFLIRQATRLCLHSATLGCSPFGHGSDGSSV